MLKILNIKSSNQSILGSYSKGDQVVFRCDAANKPLILTLPDARTTEDVIFWFKKIDSSSNTVTINTVSNQTIDGGTNYELSTTWDSVGVFSTLNGYETLNSSKSSQVAIANSVTTLTGTSSSTVSDLQYENDGNSFVGIEVSGAPGFDFVVEFINVNAFSRIKSFVYYAGNSSHIVNKRVYDYSNSSWIALDQVRFGNTYANYDIQPSNTQNLIGKGADLGKVRVSFYHNSGGTPAHQILISFCGLFK